MSSHKVRDSTIFENVSPLRYTRAYHLSLEIKKKRKKKEGRKLKIEKKEWKKRKESRQYLLLL